MKKRATYSTHSGFTLIELLVVIVIIGVLATLATLAVSSARTKARDAKRVSDLKQISTALELYLADENVYPTLITPGQPMVGLTSGKTYMNRVPSNPTPRAEGACADAEYQYAGNSDNYSLIGCTANSVGTSPAGAINYQKGGVSRSLGPTNGLVGWWDFEEGADLTVKDKSGQGNDGVFNSNSTSTIGRWGPGKVGTYSGIFTCTGASGCSGSTYGDYVTTNSFSINSPTNAFTFSAWIYLKTSVYSGQTFFNSRAGTVTHWFTRTGNSQGHQSYYGANPGTWYANNYFSGYLDKWVLLTTVIDDQNLLMTNYRNGDFYSSAVLPGPNDFQSSAAKFIGAYSAADNVKMNGYMDDVRLYNRALSASEVRAIYDATQ